MRAVYANFRGVTGVLLLAGALALAAMLLGFLPVFLVLPICFGATAAAHRRVFPGGCEDPPG